MNMNEINQTPVKVTIADRQFFHEFPTAGSHYKEVISEKLQWTYEKTHNDVIVITDSRIKKVDSYNSKCKIGWMLESPAICYKAYRFIKENNYKFKYVLTHDKRLLDRGENFIFVPLGGCWVHKNNQGVRNKTKIASIIASNRRRKEGHQLRHWVVENFSNIDAYGKAYKYVEDKSEALSDYMFSFIIENVRQDYYFSEKLIDCLVCGTVPIYWGCPSIGDFFDTRGFIVVNDKQSIEQCVTELTKEKYESMLPYVKENYEKALKYVIIEDNIFDVLRQKAVL